MPRPLPSLAVSTMLDHPVVFFLALFVANVAVLELGHRCAVRTGVNLEEDRHAQIVSLRDALGILLSLLLGFTFAMAVSRHDKRQELVVHEANAIGTAALRAGFAPEPRASAIRMLLRDYTKSRIEFFESGIDRERLQANQGISKELQTRLWEQVQTVPAQAPTPLLALLAQSIND